MQTPALRDPYIRGPPSTSCRVATLPSRRQPPIINPRCKQARLLNLQTQPCSPIAGTEDGAQPVMALGLVRSPSHGDALAPSCTKLLPITTTHVMHFPSSLRLPVCPFCWQGSSRTPSQFLAAALPCNKYLLCSPAFLFAKFPGNTLKPTEGAKGPISFLVASYVEFVQTGLQSPWKNKQT